MANEIVHVPEEHVKLGMLDVAPEQVVNRATMIANALADVIKKKKLFSKIRDKEYVRVEGWSTLGAMIGILPKEKYVKEIENGYEAYVDLIRASDGVVTGGASAICTRDEKNWRDRDEFAVRSMAITRATGKAYRLGMAWIMELAGYAGTPAEEMYGIFDDDVVDGTATEVKNKPTKKAEPKKADTTEREPFTEPVGEKQWPPEKAEDLRYALITAKVLPPETHDKHVVMFLNLLPFGIEVPTKDVVGWAKMYRGYKDETNDTTKAVDMASKKWFTGKSE